MDCATALSLADTAPSNQEFLYDSSSTTIDLGGYLNFFKNAD